MRVVFLRVALFRVRVTAILRMAFLRVALFRVTSFLRVAFFWGGGLFVRVEFV